MDVDSNNPLPDWRTADASPTAGDNGNQPSEIDSTWAGIARLSQKSWAMDNPY